MLRTTFSNDPDDDVSFLQAYPDTYPGGQNLPFTGAVEVNKLGYVAVKRPMDSVYHIVVSFPHSAKSLILTFAANGTQDIDDESWGLDNLQVTISQP